MINQTRFRELAVFAWKAHDVHCWVREVASSSEKTGDPEAQCDVYLWTDMSNQGVAHGSKFTLPFSTWDDSPIGFKKKVAYYPQNISTLCVVPLAKTDFCQQLQPRISHFQSDRYCNFQVLKENIIAFNHTGYIKSQPTIVIRLYYACR